MKAWVSRGVDGKVLGFFDEVMIMYVCVYTSLHPCKETNTNSL